MKLIAGRLPNYLINKWAHVSYSIREKRLIPALKDLTKFVKQQAAIKNDPGFAGVVMPTTETRKQKETSAWSKWPSKSKADLILCN